MSDEKMREAFEALATSYGWDTGRDDEGEFEDEQVADAFALFRKGSEWQAAQRQGGEAEDWKDELTESLCELNREQDPRYGVPEWADVRKLIDKHASQPAVPTLEWAVQKCKAMQDQGFDRVKLDVLQRDFENALDSFRPTTPQPAVPEGWKLVPVEPTKGMLNQAADNLCGKFGINYVAPKEDFAKAAYREFVEAAPEPPEDV